MPCTHSTIPPPLVRSAPEQLADFAGIAGLSDQATQSLMREIDQRDLVLALKGAVEPVRILAQVYQLVEQDTIER